MKKNIYLALFAIIAIGIGFFFITDINKIPPDKKEQMVQEDEAVDKVGGERDEHGCLVPAGYRYSEEIGACIRDWELDESQKIAAAEAVETLLGEDTSLTIIDVFRDEAENSYIVSVQKPDTEQIDVRVEDEQLGLETDGTSDISEEILAALIEKNDWEEDVDLEITVETNDGEFASGGAAPSGGGPGGGAWFAANINGEWVIIWDGNGAIYCSDIEDFEADYDVTVPTDLIEICYDEQAGVEITRE